MALVHWIAARLPAEIGHMAIMAREAQCAVDSGSAITRSGSRAFLFWVSSSMLLLLGLGAALSSPLRSLISPHWMSSGAGKAGGLSFGASASIGRSLAAAVNKRNSTIRPCEVACLIKFRSGTGNQIAELGHFLGFVYTSGLRKLMLPRSFDQMTGIFNSPGTIILPPSRKSSCSGLAPACQHLKPLFNGRAYVDAHWYSRWCNLDSSTVHEAFKKYAHPWLTTGCKKVMAAQQASPNMLTIHLRAGDLLKRDKGRYEQSPPCSFYEKLLLENSKFTKVLVVANELSHICAKWLQKRRLPRNVPVIVQKKAVWEDWCTLAGAVNLALSPSSLSHTAAVVGAPRNIYSFGDYFVSAWPLKCSMKLPGKMWRYFPPKGWRLRYKNFAAFAQQAPAKDLSGPLHCKPR